MTDRIAESPRLTARFAGLVYLMVALAGGSAEMFVRGRLIVHGDAAATAANILAHESLFRLGFAIDVAAMTGEVVLALLFYRLFSPVSRNIALLIAFFRIAWAAIYAANSLTDIAPLLLLQGANGLTAFSQTQLQALAYLSLRLQAMGFNIGLVFFGVECVAIGWLIVRSTFLPRFLGALMTIAGLCYLINSFANFLSPPLANLLFPYILLPCLPGEFRFIFWLLFVGVNASKWKQAAGVAEAATAPAGALT